MPKRKSKDSHSAQSSRTVVCIGIKRNCIEEFFLLGFRRTTINLRNNISLKINKNSVTTFLAFFGLILNNTIMMIVLDYQPRIKKCFPAKVFNFLDRV